MQSIDDSAAFRWLGRWRAPLRAAFFKLLRQALASEDGRRALLESLPGPLVPAPHVNSAELSRVVYPGLGAAPSPREATTGHAPIFITGRFRSGSTLLWNIFRTVPDCRAYYEPLNERRWFDAAARGAHTDPTHIGVSEYWREYQDLELLGAFYRESWIDRDLYMDATSWDDNLRAYVQALVDAAQPDRAVLQFNRVDFRLPWLRRTFPRAKVVHIYRHPRDQWCSSLVDIRAFPRDSSEPFEPYDQFYLLRWARDLRTRFPFLDEHAVEHPYQLFYFIWKLSWVLGRRYADCSVEFERLARDPDAELPRMFAAIGMPEVDIAPLKALIVDPRPGKWTKYADEEWFSRHERKCETILQEFFRDEWSSDGTLLPQRINGGSLLRQRRAGVGVRP